MDSKQAKLKLLIVDDEADFRLAMSQGLSRRGFTIAEAASGEAALERIRESRFDVVLLDQKMPGLTGIETLRCIREIEPSLPVIMLTGHGDIEAALAGIELQIIDFVQKPVEIEQLADRIRTLVAEGSELPLREPTVTELMAPCSLYPKVYVDEPIGSVLKVIHNAYVKEVPEKYRYGQVRSALVYGRNESFMGIVRFSDLLKLMIPPFLADSPYATSFTGMFLAQCKIIGKLDISSLVKRQVFVDADAPLMEAIHLLVEHKLINIPVTRDGQLLGVLRGRDIIIAAAHFSGALQSG